MQVKLKHCDECLHDRIIWKNHGGKKYCKSCWSAHKGIKVKPTAIRKPLSPCSPKRSKEEIIYSLKRKIFLTEHPMCEAHLSGCLGASSEIHHKAGRVGKLLNDHAKFLAVCRVCHQYIELNPIEAKEAGFSIKRL